MRTNERPLLFVDYDRIAQDAKHDDVTDGDGALLRYRCDERAKGREKKLLDLDLKFKYPNMNTALAFI